MRPASVLREHRVRGWALALGVTLVAAALRLPGLGRPTTLVFDETYYVKDAWTLLTLGYEAQWPEEPNPAFEAGDVTSYLERAAYVVHPQVGKWVISGGMALLGADDPVGWRLASALCGVLAVLVTARVARRLLRSDVAGVVAGSVMALDGMAIVHSRTALLDGVLMPLVLAGFGALLLDRDAVSARLAGPLAGTGGPLGPRLGLRPWRLVAGLLLGLACGVKWSALWFVAVFGLLAVGWDLSARYRAGVARWWQGALWRDAVPAFVSLVGVAVTTYVAGWASWFATPGAYHRQWAQEHPGEGVTWLPDVLRSFVEYHRQMWDFHTTLGSDHDYEADAWGWLIQWRPTSFQYEGWNAAEDGAELTRRLCGSDECSQAVTSLGNPLIWWLATLAVLAAAWWVVRHRDGVALAALSGVVAGWLPWFAFPERTIFTFYAIVFLPWLALCLAWAVHRFLRLDDAGAVRARAHRWRWSAVIAAATLVVLVTAFFYPSWTAIVTPRWFWALHIWLPSWV